MHVRFRCGDGVYRTFFWAALTIQPDKADAQGIFDVLKGHFEASDVSMSKVSFYASDGARPRVSCTARAAVSPG